jgi:glutamate racemase
LKKELSKYFPQINFIEQGPIVAIKLKDYLIRHPEISHKLSQKSALRFYSTENPDNLNLQTQFFQTSAPSFTHINLPEINN